VHYHGRWRAASCTVEYVSHEQHQSFGDMQTLAGSFQFRHLYGFTRKKYRTNSKIVLSTTGCTSLVSCGLRTSVNNNTCRSQRVQPMLRYTELRCELTAACPDGWCTMIREFGREWRMPGLPAVSSSEAMLAAWPTHHVATGGRTYCIVS